MRLPAGSGPVWKREKNVFFIIFLVCTKQGAANLIGADRVLHAAESPLGANADGVALPVEVVLVDAGKVEGLYPPDYASVPLQAAGVPGAEIETRDYEKSNFFCCGERSQTPSCSRT